MTPTKRITAAHSIGTLDYTHIEWEFDGVIWRAYLPLSGEMNSRVALPHLDTNRTAEVIKMVALFYEDELSLTP